MLPGCKGYTILGQAKFLRNSIKKGAKGKRKTNNTDGLTSIRKGGCEPGKSGSMPWNGRHKKANGDREKGIDNVEEGLVSCCIQDL